MANGMDSKYLKELQQVLEAEAALAREGVDLLADPEYRAIRELFIDGDMPIDEFVTRVEGLAAVRPEDNGDDDDEGGDEGDEDEGDEDEDEDLEDFEDPEELQVLRNFREQDGPEDSAAGGGEAER